MVFHRGPHDEQTDPRPCRLARGQECLIEGSTRPAGAAVTHHQLDFVFSVDHLNADLAAVSSTGCDGFDGIAEEVADCKLELNVVTLDQAAERRAGAVEFNAVCGCEPLHLMKGAGHNLAQINRLVLRLDVSQQYLHLLDRGDHPFGITHHGVDESAVVHSPLRLQATLQQEPREGLIDLVGYGRGGQARLEFLLEQPALLLLLQLLQPAGLGKFASSLRHHPFEHGPFPP